MRLFTFALLLLLAGCSKLDNIGRPKASATTGRQVLDIQLPAGRFQRVESVFEKTGGLALDTATGRLCRTFEWIALPATELKKSGLDELALCEDLVFITPIIITDPATGKDHRFLSVKSAAKFDGLAK
jgi:hypothetical protein